MHKSFAIFNVSLNLNPVAVAVATSQRARLAAEDSTLVAVAAAFSAFD